MFGLRPGTWALHSESDPRWNANGRSEAIWVTAGVPKEVQEAIKKLMMEYGEPPEDLEYSVMKD